MSKKIILIMALGIAALLLNGCQTTSSSSQVAQYKRYKVKAGDSLYHIAEEQLGDGMRYREIIRLNPDILKKENQYTFMVGTVLKMPADACQKDVNSTDEANSMTSEKTVEKSADANEVVLDVSLTDEQTFGKYTVRTYRSESGGKAFYEILVDGERRYAEYDEGEFTIGTIDGEPNSLIAIGKDITGYGVPNLVIEYEYGGRFHSGYYVVFEIGDKYFQKLAVIDASHFGGGMFCNMDGDNNLEFVTCDKFYEMPRCRWLQAPQAEVVLRYENHGYHLAIDQMRKPAPDRKTLKKRAELLRNDKRWQIKDEYDRRGETQEIRQQIAQTTVDLIYSGHLNLGWEFFDMAWPDNDPDKKEAREGLESDLENSRYFGELQALWVDEKVK